MSPLVSEQVVKADVLHQLSELRQKCPVVDVHVFVPHKQLIRFATVPLEFEQNYKGYI